MSLSDSRWHVVTESTFPWEREALEWLRAQLPDQAPWQVWTNFEFIDDQGKVNEVDALVLSPAGLFLVEIKSRPGRVSGDAHTWLWETDGRAVAVDNPFLLADRKAKRLAALLRRQSAVVKAKIRVPFIQALVFLAATHLDCELSGTARAGTYLRGRPGKSDDDGIVAALAEGIRSSSAPRVDNQQMRAIGRGLNEAGVRPSNKSRRVGDYQLVKLLDEGEEFQDWQASHVSIDSVLRRVRIYTLAKTSSPEMRAARLRQARREFEVLEGIDHPGILRCRDYKETEYGPALIYDFDPKAVRLDWLLRDRGAQLSLDLLLQLLRSIAEALQYAHGKRLYHRALGPQSVLVRGLKSGTPQIQLMNWRTAARDAATTGTVHRTTGTRHVDAYVEDPGLVYLAPEALRADPCSGAQLDVFSIGCLTYHIFSGQPPAASMLELQEKLRIGQGLRLSDVLDGCGQRLQDLVQLSTCPDVFTRWETVREFLDELDKVEDELTTPDPERTVDPSVAVAGERLEGGFTVERRMGRGSASDVLLVKQDGGDDVWVLKVANDVSHNETLLSEGEALSRLRHPNIIAFKGQRTVAGRTALVLKSAGDATLAQRLKDDGRLNVEMLSRFGEELLDAVRYLEDQGVVHRDIKPENIGITPSRTGKLQLILFDFSLCRTPAENLTAGTPPYLDPFLGLRPQKRWDLYAERFAAAVTLYEMAVGRPPRWGDGVTAPEMSEQEVTIDRDVFDPMVREHLSGFFAKALRRDYRDRFDHAESMLRAWRAVFSESRASAPAMEDEGFAALARQASGTTTMAELGYSLDAQEVLERLGIHNARELLAQDRVRFRYLRGVGDRIRSEIRLRAKELARLRPDLAPQLDSLQVAEPEAGPEEAVPSINELARLLLPRRPAGDERPEDAALSCYLGLEEKAETATADRWPWPALGAAARFGGMERGVMTTALIQARERWLKIPAFTDLRREIESLILGHGRVMTAPEAASALLTLRGCAAADEDERQRLARAVLRAAVEAESQLDSPRFELFAHSPVPLLATDAAWADYARRVGEKADECADADPLWPPPRVLDELNTVSRPATSEPDEGAGSLNTRLRMLRLAVSASSHSALSSRQEIYPVGMSALQALRHAQGALVGAAELTIDELRRRVQGRYPRAQILPNRPLLDQMLREAAIPLTWEETAQRYLRPPSQRGATALTTRFWTATRTPSTGAEVDEDARQFEERLERNLRQGGLLVMSVTPGISVRAEAKLIEYFCASRSKEPAIRRLSLDALLLSAMKRAAEAAEVDWQRVLRADAAPPTSRDWQNLQRLVRNALSQVESALLDSPIPLLVVHPGLLARYDLLGLMAKLEGRVGRPGSTPALWVLLPSESQGLPKLDGQAVPLVNAASAAIVPRAWIDSVGAEKTHSESLN